MAHFAKVENGIVTQVLVIANSDCGGGQFPASEAIGQAFLASLGLEGEWKQTSYSSSFRENYASPGWVYDADADVFVTPQPYPSWTLDSNYDWQPPTPRPSTGGPHRWSEEELEWVAI
jgi:hypothetical protein